MRTIVFVLSLAAPAAGFAQTVYKCNDGGRVVLQQAPCTGGQKIDVKINDLGPPIRAASDPRVTPAGTPSRAAAAAEEHARLPVVA